MSFNQTWRETPTKLFLNGPNLSFTSEPSTITLDAGGSGTFVGLATVSFTASNPGAELDGTILYQWYRKLASESSFSALGVGGTFYSGETTRILSIDYALSPDVHNSQYYLEASYTPVGLADTSLTGGDALPEPITTGTVSLFTNPALAIAVQPSDQTAVVNSNATFTVTPTVSDTTQGSVTYQWSLNGNTATDGTTQTTTVLSNVSSKYLNSNTTNGLLSITIPDNATDVQIEISGGSGVGGGSYLNGTGGGGAYGRQGQFVLPDGGRDLQLYIGNAASGSTGGGNNTNYTTLKGGNGGTGNSNGGGGGSGSFVYDATLGDYIIVAAGGGGGGGGAQNSGTSNSGSNAGAFASLSSLSAIGSNSTGDNGDSITSGGGGGGGGSGYIGGAGGAAGANIAPPPPEPPDPPFFFSPPP